MGGVIICNDLVLSVLKNVTLARFSIDKLNLVGHIRDLGDLITSISASLQSTTNKA